MRSMPTSTRYGVPRHGHGGMATTTACDSVLPCPSRSGPPGSWSAEAHGRGRFAKKTDCCGRWQAAAAASEVHTMEGTYARAYKCKRRKRAWTGEAKQQCVPVMFPQTGADSKLASNDSSSLGNPKIVLESQSRSPICMITSNGDARYKCQVQ